MVWPRLAERRVCPVDGGAMRTHSSGHRLGGGARGVSVWELRCARGQWRPGQCPSPAAGAGPCIRYRGSSGRGAPPLGNSLPHPPWGSAAGEQLLGVGGLLSLPCARDKGQIGCRARRPQTGGAAESRRVPLKMGRGTPSCGFLSGGWLTHRLEAHGPTAPVP